MTKRATHRAIAEVTLRARTISVAEALPLCTHLIQAEDWDAFMPVFVQLLQAAETQEQAAALDWAAMLFSPDARWPEDFSPSMRIMIRTLQVRLLELAGKPIARLVTDLETLLSSVGDERADQLAVGFARFHLGLVRDDLSALAQARNALAASRALRRSVDDEDTLPFVPESVLWLALLQADGYQELRDLFAELRGMPSEERAAVFANPPSLETYLLLVDRVIGSQGTSSDATDTSNSLALLTELATFGGEADLPSLIVAAARGIAIVQADRLGRLDQALNTLRQVPGGELPFARFVLAWTEGRLLVAHDPTRDAFVAFAEALAVTPTADFPIYRAEALSYGMAAAARSGRWSEARRWAGEAIRHVGLPARPEAPDPWEGLKLLGELAWIHSLAGNRLRAVGALFAIVRRLVAIDEPPTTQFRTLVVRLGYLLQWLASIATTGQPPDAEVNGQVYTEPVPGFLAHSGDPVQLPNDTIGLDTLCWQLGRFAGASGSLRIARWAYVQSAARARRDSHYGKTILADGLSAALETWLGNFDAGLDAALSGARAIIVMPTDAPDELDLAPDALDQRWSALPTGQRAAEQGFHLFHGVLWPTITRLLDSGANLDTAERALDRLMIGLNRSSVTIVELDRWQRMIASARAIFARTLRRAELSRLLDVPMENYERCVLYATLMRAADSLPSEVVQAQVVVLLFTREGRNLGEFVRDSFARWLVDYWRAESAERSFRLASPGLLRSELVTVMAGTTEVGDVVRVLLAAALASGVRLPAAMHAGLQQLRSR